MPQMSTFAHLPQTTTPNLHTGSQIDGKLQIFTGPQYPSKVSVDKQLQNAFQSLEQGQTSVEPVSELEPASQPQEADLLARTAGLLVESVEHERNPKFTNSQFLGLMKQLRDRKAIVEGNDIVAAPPQAGQENTVSVDLKGKGKAVPSVSTAIQEPGDPQLQAISSAVPPAEQVVPMEFEEDANEAYFRQDNEDYANYWKAHHAPVPPVNALPQEWQQLQRDWERFEATATGVRPLAKYPFQPGNPYLLGERSHTHAMHGQSIQDFSSTEVCGFYFVLFECFGMNVSLQSVLEMEAAVQRDPTNARAWYELGVKQQENEREQQAILALQRALELEPTHLPSWLALGISYTNEGDRHGTYEALRNWVRNNPAYLEVVAAYEAGDGAQSDSTDEGQALIGCLIAMARGVPQPGMNNTEVDADVQIALAVLLNTNGVGKLVCPPPLNYSC